jgi:virginiamycin B lyase
MISAFASRYRIARPLLAALAFITYAAAILWHHGAYKSIWQLEQQGSLILAASYLYYDQPFGSIDGSLWHYVVKRFSSDSQDKSADALLKLAANHDRSPKVDSIGRITTAGAITEFPLHTRTFPRAIVAGPDGALWFTQYESGKIGRITTAGAVTEFAIPSAGSQPFGITMGTDGALWFTEYAGNKIGRLCLPASLAVNPGCGNSMLAGETAGHAAAPNITEFAIPTGSSGPTFITLGPDGAVWFAEQDARKIGRITPAGVISEFPLPTGTGARAIAAGPDGNLWFTDYAGNSVGRITTDGTVTKFPIPTRNSDPWAITAGPDGALWFTEYSGNKIGRITTAGVITEFPLPNNCTPIGTCSPLDIITGPDGALWFTESDSFGNKIARITTAGTITEFDVPFGTSPQYIAAGPDGALWFTDRQISIPATLKPDGAGVGYAFFVTASLFVFGPYTLSLVLGFILLLGASVLAFLLRFPDDRALAVPVLFLALTLMLLTPHGTSEWWIDQSPIGGTRFFVIAGILPTLHVVLELLGSTKRPAKPSSYALLGLQFALLLCAATARMSMMYFVGAIVLAALLSLWARRRDAWSRRFVVAKFAVLIMVAGIVLVAGRLLAPSAYEETGLSSEVFWHRAFSTLGAHPDWPFGNLATTFECRPEIPEGLLPGILDRNGHCAYYAAVKKGAEPGTIFGTQYEKLLRRAFVQVAKEYPRQVLETYLLYKPLMIWKTLSDSTKVEISRGAVPVLIALAVQIIILVFMARLPDGETSQLRRICEALIIIAAFSLAAPLFAYSSIGTSTDIICYMYVGLLLALVGAVRWLPLRRYASA